MQEGCRWVASNHSATAWGLVDGVVPEQSRVGSQSEAIVIIEVLGVWFGLWFGLVLALPGRLVLPAFQSHSRTSCLQKKHTW